MHSITDLFIFFFSIACQAKAGRIWNTVAKAKLSDNQIYDPRTLQATLWTAVGLGTLKYISLFSPIYPEHGHSTSIWLFLITYVSITALLVHYMAHCLFEQQFGALSWTPKLAVIATLLTFNGVLYRSMEILEQAGNLQLQDLPSQLVSPIHGLVWTYYMLLLYGMFRVYATHLTYPFLNRLPLTLNAKTRSIHREVYLFIFLVCYSALLVSADTLLLRVEHLLQEGLFSARTLWNLALTGGFTVLFTLLASSYSRSILLLVSMRQTWGNLGYMESKALGHSPDIQSMTGRALDLMKASLFFWRINQEDPNQRPVVADLEKLDRSSFQVTLNAPYSYALPYSGSLPELWRNTLHHEDYQKLMEQIDSLLKGHIPQVNHVIRIQTEALGWQIYHCRCRIEKVSQFKGALYCLYGGLENITQQVRENEYLSTASVRQLNALRIIGHDLVTPLSVIQTNALLLEKLNNIDSSQKAARALVRIRGASDEAMQYLRATLQYAQNDGKTQEREALTDLPKMIHTIIESQAEKFKLEDSCIEADLHNVPNQVRLNGLLFKTVLNNVVSNALKYGQPHKKAVQLKIHRSFDTSGKTMGLAITVRDYGRGMPADFLANRCMRATGRASNVGDTPGEGIGLLIVKNAVQALNGTISIRSTPDIDRGCEVSLFIPFCSGQTD